MPIGHKSPARVPNFSYDVEPRKLFLLDSVVQKDMSRSKRIVGGESTTRPYAVDGCPAPPPSKMTKRILQPKDSARYEAAPKGTGMRSNHLQNCPSVVKEPAKKLRTARANDDADPIGVRPNANTQRPVRQTRINQSSNIFGPPVPAYTKPPPATREPFVERNISGHIRPTLLGSTDAHKFASTRPY
ncbi:hypothetical protein DIPPA_17519 [Diplonema papillatum]|nr:hypothetical protein DIPPA_17519 [Diplonema papillatum]|eukprot:gene20623-31769_t